LQLQQQMRLLAKRIDELSFAQSDGSEEITNERPPHY
ncbi:MAG: homocysteine methyltransferase, partial [Moraxellaceae bacterium]